MKTILKKIVAATLCLSLASVPLMAAVEEDVGYEGEETELMETEENFVGNLGEYMVIGSLVIVPLSVITLLYAWTKGKLSFSNLVTSK